MPTPSDAGPRRGARRRSYGVAPYVAGRTTKEYVADGTMRLVEADDEDAALAAYAAAHGLTANADPVRSTSGKRVLVTLSDGREYVARYLKAALAETIAEEPIVVPPAVAPRSEAGPRAEPDDGVVDAATPLAPEIPPPPPAPPEFIPLGEIDRDDLERIRPDVQPRSWDIAAALWGLESGEPRSVQDVAERFAVSPGFVRTVATAMVRLALADDGSSAR